MRSSTAFSPPTVAGFGSELPSGSLDDHLGGASPTRTDLASSTCGRVLSVTGCVEAGDFDRTSILEVI